MQIGHSKNLLGKLLKMIIFILLAFALYRQIFQRDDISDLWSVFLFQLQTYNVFLLLLCFSLLFFNWGTESRKWQLLMKPLETVSFFRAYGAVLSGITLSLFTPNRIGEYAGRILLVHKADKLQSVSVTLVGSYAQLIVNSLTGTLGFTIFCFHNTYLDKWYVLVFMCLIWLGLIMAWLFYYKIGLAGKIVKKIRFLQKHQKYFQPLSTFTNRELSIVLLWSFVRNFIYWLQFVLLLWFFGITISLSEAWILINSIFFVQTLIPSIAMLELGIRGNIALFFMTYHTTNNLGVLAATFSLWFINLVIPSLAGLLIIFSINIFKNGEGD